MSFNFSTAYPSGVMGSNAQVKALHLQAVKLTFADFATGGLASVKAVLPADASIVGFRVWNKTILSGGGITAATLSIGVTGTAGKYVTSFNALGATGAYAFVPTAVTNIFQESDPTAPADISLLFTGTATTGNPTAGEMYVLIEYVR
jgi:hypothetical protein